MSAHMCRLERELARKTGSDPGGFIQASLDDARKSFDETKTQLSLHNLDPWDRQWYSAVEDAFKMQAF